MLTLDEAIKHCEEVADVCEDNASKYDLTDDFESYMASKDEECASDHRQLAEWLRELQQRRKYENGCQYCKYKVRSDEDEPCVICSHNYTNKFRDDGTREVKADDT